jgi:hypothetical protein
MHIIYLDLDGVIFDFERWAESTIGSDWKLEIDSHEWGRFRNYPNLYRDLPLMSDALELYHGCLELVEDRNQVQILTALPSRAGHRFPEAAKDKIEAVHRHLDPNIRVHFGPLAKDKQYHKIHHLDVLIDDMEININQWNEVGGIGILHRSAEKSLIETKAKLQILK